MAKEELHRKKAAAIEQRLRPGKMQDPKFEVFMEEFLQQNHNVRNPISSKPLLRYFSGKKLSQINAWIVGKYKNERRKEVSPPTVNRELACLKALFSIAVRAKKSTTNPVKEIKLYPENKGRTRVLSPGEEVRLMEAAEKVAPYLRNFLYILLYTGARLSELLGLKWADIDWIKNNFTFNKTKNGFSRTIPVNKKVQAVIHELRARPKDGDHVFPGLTVGRIERDFKKARETADIPNFRIHDLRHSFATREAAKRVSSYTLQALLGHRTAAMVSRYINPQEDEMRKAVERLDENEVTPIFTSLAEIG
ncbi:MAG: site-specific integrase [Candidatus Pacebacteria bacterium]|nr:site-specific integrase [Candidatus Paceibacterota bacterium]